MAKRVKTTKRVSNPASNYKKVHKYLIAFPLIALAIKIVVMFNIHAGSWAGADGENYLKGVDGLLNGGFFSKEGLLSYWPAGYPIIIWPLAAITITKFAYILSLIQSLFFAYSTYFLTKKMSSSSLKWLAVTASFLISFNPTLSLSSLVIGYESIVASCLIMIVGLVLSSDTEKKRKINLFLSGLLFSIANFTQPRFIAIALAIYILWSLSIASKAQRASLIAIGMALSLLLPTLLIIRNQQSVGAAIISTNLGVTMRLGAGESTSGGYNHSGPVVPCNPKSGEQGISDNQLVQCVIKWYLTNPTKTLKLAVNKTQYFWSPWSGPKAEGTMARNPWLKISPVQNIKDSKEGAKLAFGPIGKSISYLWILGQIAFLFLGFWAIRRRGKFEANFANLLLVPVVLSWLISIGTIGDHRFRIPTMGLSLILQAAGFAVIREKTITAL